MDLPPGSELADFMRVALAHGDAAGRAGELPVGAVLVIDGEVVAAGRSRIVERGSVLAHAELEALTAAGARLRDRTDAVLVTTVEPCLMCLGAVVRTGVAHVVFAVSNRSAGMAMVTALPSVRTYIGGVLEADARDLFARYAPSFGLR
jgi:tRNA(adenine34) deaminase